MHLRYAIYAPLALGVMAMPRKLSERSELATETRPFNAAARRNNVLHSRQGDQCPGPGEDALLCGMCGGKGGDGKCVGITIEDEVDAWKGCDCLDDPDYSIDPVGLVRPDYREHQQAIRDRGHHGDPAVPPPPPPKQNKILNVLADWLLNPNPDDPLKVNWLFFVTGVDEAVGCRGDPLASKEYTVNPANTENDISWPVGIFDLAIPGFSSQCQYRENIKETGTLSCPGQPDIACIFDIRGQDPNNADPIQVGNYECGDYRRDPVFICEY